MQKFLIIAVLATAMTIALWRTAHPPIQPRFDSAIAKGSKFLDLGQYYEARRHFGRALTLNSTDESARLGYAKAAVNYFRRFEPPAAAQIEQRVKQLVGKFPNDPHLLMFLGDSAFWSGHYANAASYYQRALTLRPSLVQAQFALGLANDALGDTQVAVELLRAATSRESQSPCHRIMLAETYLSRGAAANAAATYLEAIASFRHSFAAYYPLTEALRESGSADKALAYHQLLLLRLQALRKAPAQKKHRNWVLNYRRNIQIGKLKTKIDYARLSYALSAILAKRMDIVTDIKNEIDDVDEHALTLIKTDVNNLRARLPAESAAIDRFESLFQLGTVTTVSDISAAASARFCGSIYHGVRGI